MAKINRFEDLSCWREARELTQKLYVVCKSQLFVRDMGLADQVKRGAVSIMANIAEGFSRQGDREFVQFLFIAKASASELQSHLYVALDQGYILPLQFEDLYAHLEKIQRLISNFIRYLRSCTAKKMHSPSSSSNQARETRRITSP